MRHLFGIQKQIYIGLEHARKIPFSEEGFPEKQQDRDLLN
jgi:hypothetical protein